MDETGHWHNTESLTRLMAPTPPIELPKDTERRRIVATLQFGERVEIVKRDGTRIVSEVWKIHGNKVTLRTLPIQET